MEPKNITAEVAQAYAAPGAFRRGDSIAIDPVARKITHINGDIVPAELHTDRMQEHVEQELGAQQYVRVGEKIMLREEAERLEAEKKTTKKKAGADESAAG